MKNVQGNFLDLIFSSEPDNVLLRKASVPLSKVDKDYHEPIEFTFELSDVDQLYPAVDSRFTTSRMLISMVSTGFSKA